MGTLTVNLEGTPVVVAQGRVELTKLRLDQDNPRIGLYRDSQPKTTLLEADIRHAIRNRSPHAYSKLRDSIEINGAIINPIWISPEEAGTHLVIEGNTRFINDANGMGMGMFLGNDLLQAVTRQVFLPTMLTEELLKRSHGHIGCQGDWLDALALKVRKLALHIDRKMCPRVLACKAVIKAFQKTGEHRSQSANLLGIHAWVSLTS